VIVEEPASKVARVRRAAPGIPDEAPGQKEQQDGPPPRSAEKPAWVEYARSQGASDEELQGTKEELIAKYGERR
jgi:hypothetical protein